MHNLLLPSGYLCLSQNSRLPARNGLAIFSIKEWIRRTSEFAEWRSGLKTKLRRWVRTKGFLKGQTAGAMWSVCTMVTVIAHLPGLLLSWLHSLKIQNLGKQHAFGLTKVKLAPGFRGGKKQDLTHFVFQKKKKSISTHLLILWIALVDLSHAIQMEALHCSMRNRLLHCP